MGNTTIALVIERMPSTRLARRPMSSRLDASVTHPLIVTLRLFTPIETSSKMLNVGLCRTASTTRLPSWASESWAAAGWAVSTTINRLPKRPAGKWTDECMGLSRRVVIGFYSRWSKTGTTPRRCPGDGRRPSTGRKLPAAVWGCRERSSGVPLRRRTGWSWERGLIRDEALARPNGAAAPAHDDLDRVPLAVLRCGRRVAQEVLLAQLAGDPRCGRVQIAVRHDDLGATAAVVRNRAQGVDVHALAGVVRGRLLFRRRRRSRRWRRND